MSIDEIKKQLISIINNSSFSKEEELVNVGNLTGDLFIDKMFLDEYTSLVNQLIIAKREPQMEETEIVEVKDFKPTISQIIRSNIFTRKIVKGLDNIVDSIKEIQLDINKMIEEYQHEEGILDSNFTLLDDEELSKIISERDELLNKQNLSKTLNIGLSTESLPLSGIKALRPNISSIAELFMEMEMAIGEEYNYLDKDKNCMDLINSNALYDGNTQLIISNIYCKRDGQIKTVNSYSLYDNKSAEFTILELADGRKQDIPIARIDAKELFKKMNKESNYEEQLEEIITK
ncbi:MAG: hypothetical protein PHQ64_02775 [Bacilli bacterium]|nr:hypothetical protein [Bacilli bacterium]